MSTEADQARFWAKVREDASGCWVWTGAVSSGYGRCWLAGRSRRAHRLAYEWLVGPVPDGLVLDHLCLNRSCVNPQHLEAVTQAENVRRWAAAIVACPQGHPRGPENVYVSSRGYRSCRTCTLDRMRRWRLVRAAA